MTILYFRYKARGPRPIFVLLCFVTVTGFVVVKIAFVGLCSLLVCVEVCFGIC